MSAGVPGNQDGLARVAHSRTRAGGSPGRRILRLAMHGLLRALTLAQAAAVQVARALGPRQRPLPPEGAEILLTGTFYADNWVSAHIAPLAASRRCRRLRVVTDYPIASTDKIERMAPPAWVRRIAGGTGARLLTFVALALRTRPHVVGGFHLLLNGLVALPLARLTGARAFYFCGGGPTEVLGGGVWSQNRLFTLMETPDAVVERRLLNAVRGFDVVVTMGRRAIDYFRSRGVDTTFRVVSGGMDSARFSPSGVPPQTDLILVARLSAVKRGDLFLRAVALAAAAHPEVSALIVGSGPLSAELERLAADLGLAGRVSFVGHQLDVEAWLRRARVFVLTSDSEGLSLALMEAMMCGLPAVVSDVGDLPELVEDGVNGFLVRERTPEAFADAILRLLEDPARLAAFSANARRSALRYDTAETARLWDGILTEGATRKPRRDQG